VLGLDWLGLNFLGVSFLIRRVLYRSSAIIDMFYMYLGLCCVAFVFRLLKGWLGVNGWV